jgi:sec-independent protein translocase protein TatA
MPFGPLEIVILLFIVLLLFGAKRLPELGRSLGSGMREFKDSVTGNDEQAPPRTELPPAELDERERPAPRPAGDARP